MQHASKSHHGSPLMVFAYRGHTSRPDSCSPLPQRGYWHEHRLIVNNPFIQVVTLHYRSGYYEPDTDVRPDISCPYFLQLDSSILTSPLVQLELDGDRLVRVYVTGPGTSLPDDARFHYTPAGKPLSVRCSTAQGEFDMQRWYPGGLSDIARVVTGNGAYRRMDIHLLDICRWHGCISVWNPFLPPVVLIWDGRGPLILPDGTSRVEVANLPRYLIRNTSSGRQVVAQWWVVHSGDAVQSILPAEGTRPGEYPVICQTELFIQQRRSSGVGYVQAELMPAAPTSRYGRPYAELSLQSVCTASPRVDALPGRTRLSVVLSSTCESTPARARYGYVHAVVQVFADMQAVRGTTYGATVSGSIYVAGECGVYPRRDVVLVPTGLSVSALIYLRGFPAPQIVELLSSTGASVRRGAAPVASAEIHQSCAGSKGRHGSVIGMLELMQQCAGTRYRQRRTGSHIHLLPYAEGGRYRDVIVLDGVAIASEAVAGRYRDCSTIQNITAFGYGIAGGHRLGSAQEELVLSASVNAQQKPTRYVDGSTWSLLELASSLVVYKHRPLRGLAELVGELTGTATRHGAPAADLATSSQVSASVRRAASAATTLELISSVSGERKTVALVQAVVQFTESVWAVKRSLPMLSAGTRITDTDCQPNIPNSRQPYRLSVAMYGTELGVTVTDQESKVLLNNLYPNLPERSQLALWQSDNALFILDGDIGIMDVPTQQYSQPPSEPV